MQETWVRSLDRKDPLEKEMATHSHILAWKIPWTEETGGLLSTGLQRVGNNWATKQQKTSKTEVYYQGFSFNRVFRFLFSEVMLKKRPVHSTAGLIHHEKWRWRSFSHVWLFVTPWTSQSIILEWVAFPFSRVSSRPRDWTQVSHIADSLPAESPGKPKNTEVGSLSLLQWIFPSQESNRGLLHCRWILYQLSYEGSPMLWFPCYKGCSYIMTMGQREGDGDCLLNGSLGP